ncbi:MAG TPA: PAS domain S-box protein [Pyrinomonadaceae bacterium]
MRDESIKATRQSNVPEDLQTSEIRYRRLFESARDGILILDAASRRITDVNPYMVEFLGYSRDEFLGKELWEIGLFKDKGESQAAFRELQETGYIRYEDLPLQSKAGKQWNVEFVSNVYREDGRRVIQCNIRDLTERRNVEERLIQSEQRLRAIFEASHEGILVEENERIHYVNQSYAHMFGYDDPGELIGRHISVVVSAEDRERLLEFGRGRLRGERSPSEYEFKGRRKDGSTIDVEASVSASNVADSSYITTMIRDITERKRQEQALRESENKYRLLMEQASDGIHTYDMQGNFIDTNSKLCEMLGYTREELLRLNVKDLVPVEDLAANPIRFDELGAGKTLLNERRLRRKDGTLLQVEISGKMIRENVLQAIIRDITERKRQEDSLRELTRQLERQTNIFNTTLSSITDFAYIFDRDGRFLYANRPLLDLWGIELNEAVGKNFFDLQYPDDLALRLQQQIQQVFDTGQALRDETPYTSPAGAEGFYEYIFTPVKASDGTVEVVAGSTRDYTERRRVETALRESRERLQMAMDAAKIYSWEMNLTTRQMEWSSNLERAIGFQLPSDFAAAISFVHPEDREKTARLIAQAIRGGGDYESEFRLVNPKSGEIVWLRGQGVPVGNAQNSPQRFVGVTQNITERKRAEEELVRLNEQLEQRVADRTAELVGINDSLQAEIVERQRAERERESILRRLVMAQEEERRRIARDMHDQFGQQLTVLLLKLGMLKEDCGEQKGLCEQVAILEEVAGRLDADVEFLVWELRPSVLDDLGLQEAITNFAQNWSRHFGIPVEVLTHGAGEESSTSEIDTVLYRVAQEALNNVAKHSRATSATVLLERRADVVSLIIEDDGVGFDAEDTGATAQGLGLVGMRERAALVGGTAEVESHQGEGARVIVRVPAHPASAEGGGA